MQQNNSKCSADPKPASTFAFPGILQWLVIGTAVGVFSLHPTDHMTRSCLKDRLSLSQFSALVLDWMAALLSNMMTN
jgi:hypothetical protein